MWVKSLIREQPVPPPASLSVQDCQASQVIPAIVGHVNVGILSVPEGDHRNAGPGSLDSVCLTERLRHWLQY